VTAPNEQKEKTAAFGFMAFMALALGGAGVLVAALAVGIERMWSGGAQERSRAGERDRGWLTEQRAWLDADHKARTARQKARADWLTSGADPNREPRRPSPAKRFGNSVRRLIANLAVAVNDFATGARDGWKAAVAELRNGGSPRDIAGARPPICANCKRDRVPVAADGLCADCSTAAEQAWRRPVDGQATQDSAVELDGEATPVASPTRTETSPTPEQAAPAAAEDSGTAPATAAGLAPVMSWLPTEPSDPVTNQKESQPMTDGPTTNSPAPAAATESNATVLRQKLDNTKQTLNRVAELTDQLAAERSTLGHQVRDASEFATSTGQSAQAQQALDESNALAISMGEHLGHFSQGAVSAEASMTQAGEGLRVAEHAEDALRNAGADGRAVAPANGAGA
jgi:hypothetical protein